ncbi:sugar-binding transcriptional regulator [Macrococcus carouselicus]|uniref:HTH domain-containing protein n=1 Tax=Macrococcus carouselicus TaxID=69969 RepID=A0A9Q8CMW5_9STAP|nr:sugar-binding domain-containing protein [Macrococcus carouselicus]TDM03705.1 HTH domain-containing protein [Macrococcus carouselicus]
MDHIFAVQQRLIPDIIEKMQRRFNVLSLIQHQQPIGRRALAERLNMTERILRSDVESLKAEHLIDILPKGMIITAEGEEVLAVLSRYMSVYNDLSALGSELSKLTGIRKIIVVKGDADENTETVTLLGIEASRYLQSLLCPDMTVTVTGGSSTASIASHLAELPFDVTFTPARGGLGEDMIHQANFIVAKMAEFTGGHYETLYVPDQVSEKTYKNLIEEPSVRSVLDQIKSADIVVHGIGDASKMAARRRTDPEVRALLKQNHAVGEAFGYYYDKKGNIVYKVRTIGLQREDVLTKEHIIAVAGGTSKTEAISAYLRIAPPQTTLITDEAAAKQLLKALAFDNNKN